MSEYTIFRVALVWLNGPNTWVADIRVHTLDEAITLVKQMWRYGYGNNLFTDGMRIRHIETSEILWEFRR